MQVSDSYADTDVMDAFEAENFYEDWRVVSVRMRPAAPRSLPRSCVRRCLLATSQDRMRLENHMLFGFTLVERFAAIGRFMPYIA